MHGCWRAILENICPVTQSSSSARARRWRRAPYEQLFAIAPKDGTYIGAFSTGPIIEPLVSCKVKYKISDFTAIGALEKDVSLCVTWHASAIKTLQDAKAREVTLAGTGLSSPTDMIPLALNAVLGTKFRVVSGYVGAGSAHCD